MCERCLQRCWSCDKFLFSLPSVSAIPLKVWLQSRLRYFLWTPLSPEHYSRCIIRCGEEEKILKEHKEGSVMCFLLFQHKQKPLSMRSGGSYWWWHFQVWSSSSWWCLHWSCMARARNTRTAVQVRHWLHSVHMLSTAVGIRNVFLLKPWFNQCELCL